MPPGDATKPYRLGTWLVEPDLNRLSDGDRIVMLEPRLMDVLICLASRPGKLVSADELLETVWHGRILVDNTIYQAVAHLRRVLGDDVHHPRYIETIAKKGYRLICPVVPAATDPEMPEIASHPPDSRRHGRRILAISAVIVSLAIAIVLIVKPQLWDHLFSTDDGPSNRSVAVLPFVDMSEAGDQQYLGDGVSEELIHVLSNLPDLRVTARTSSFAFRDRNEDIRQIGSRLNVSTILEGSIRRDGDRIRVTSQLVDARNGYHLWSQTFDRRATDIVNIQREIAMAVARTFEYREFESLAADSQAARPNEMQAYDYYLLGIHKLRTNIPHGAKQAIQHFERAIEIDPSFARAYAGLSESYSSRYFSERDQEFLDKAESAAEYALLLDDQSAEAFAALGRAKGVKQDYSGAEAAYRKAVELQPNDVHMHMYLALHITMQGRREEALEMVKDALEVDPMSGRLNHWMGQYYNTMPYSDWDMAFKYFKQAMDRDPDYPWPYRAVGRHYQTTGQLDQAIPYFRKVVDLTSGPTNGGEYMESLALTYVDIGDYTSAAQVIRRTKEVEPEHIGAINCDIQLNLARGNFRAARDIVHDLLPTHIDDDLLIGLFAFYELVIGDAVHAEEIYRRLAAAPEPPDKFGNANLYRSNELSWGMLGAVNLAYLHNNNGNTRAAQELLGHAREFIESSKDRQRHVGNGLYVLAQIAAVEGNVDLAIDSFRKAVDDGWTRAWFGRIDPIMADLRKDARYLQILEGLEERLLEMRENSKMLVSIN